MKTIKINSLKLTNFKGIRSLHLNQLSDQTFIHGDNGTGKTTIFDAFTWLLFGKDSTDRKDFEIKTLNKNNDVIPKIDHEVEAVIKVDGEVIELRRIYREKWVTRRGSAVAEFNGHETVYEWNGVPMNAGDYTNKINVIVDEKVFKMITNPIAFNSLRWQDQRDVLIDMSGGVTDLEVAAGDPEFEALMDKLTNKSLDEYKKQIKASISKSKVELKGIPTRIDEVERAKPEPLDFKKLRDQEKAKQKELDAVNEQISDELKAQQAIIDQKSELKKEIQKLDFEISDIKHDYQKEAQERFRNQDTSQEKLATELNQKQSELKSLEATLETLTSKLNSKKEELERLSKEVVSTRNKWHEINAEEIKLDGIDDCCPTCKQSLPEADIEVKKEEMIETLKIGKQKRLKDINFTGKSLKEAIEAFTKERDVLVDRINDGNNLIVDVKKAIVEIESKQSDDDTVVLSQVAIYQQLIDNDTKIAPIEEKIKKMTEELDSIKGVDVDDLKDKRDTLRTDIQSLEREISTEEEIKRHDVRIKELNDQESEMAQAVADMEKELYTIEAFEKVKAGKIEESVNKRFNFVKFKLFESQINGGEVPTCKALIDGVPFSDANTASKINAGIDIINTLCLHYGATAPIFIDNRESVVELIHTDSQVINLVVSEPDKKLRVVGVEAEELETV